MQANLCAFGSGSKPCRASLAPNSEHTLRLVWLPHYLRATPALCSALDASTAEPWHGSICLMSTSNSRAHKRKSFFLPYVSAWAGKTFLISTSVQLQYLVAFEPSATSALGSDIERTNHPMLLSGLPKQDFPPWGRLSTVNEAKLAWLREARPLSTQCPLPNMPFSGTTIYLTLIVLLSENWTRTLTGCMDPWDKIKKKQKRYL